MACGQVYISVQEYKSICFYLCAQQPLFVCVCLSVVVRCFTGSLLVTTADYILWRQLVDMRQTVYKHNLTLKHTFSVGTHGHMGAVWILSLLHFFVLYLKLKWCSVWKCGLRLVISLKTYYIYSNVYSISAFMTTFMFCLLTLLVYFYVLQMMSSTCIEITDSV